MEGGIGLVFGKLYYSTVPCDDVCEIERGCMKVHGGSSRCIRVHKCLEITFNSAFTVVGEKETKEAYPG